MRVHLQLTGDPHGVADDVVARVPQARWVLGTTFVPTDLAWYAAGALLGALVVALLGLVGTPPTAVFIGKVTTAAAAWDGRYAWLAVVVFVNTLVSLFYYLRWIAPCYQRADGRHDAFPVTPWSVATAVGAAALSLALGVGAGLVWRVVAG